MTSLEIPASTDGLTTAEDVTSHTILRSDWVPCKAAFIDCRTPGSDRKDNYSFIGIGVSQNSTQVINLQKPHGFNLGAAGMPNGTTNSLHMHFTAEVFINFGGEYNLRWGADGTQGEFVTHDGDVISVPTWIFRGFTNIGPDEGILLTVLGHDDTGGIIWGPKVLQDAEGFGLSLTKDNRLIDTAAGDVVPTDVELIRPLEQRYIDELTSYSADEFRTRVTTPADRAYLPNPFLCSPLTGGRAELALVIGYGMSEHRRHVPRLHEPHTFNVAWLRAVPGEGMLRHRHEHSQVLTAKAGRWAVTVETANGPQSVELGYLDTFSVPAGAWRTIRCLEAGETGSGELLVVNSGDGRVLLEWAPEVVSAAREAGLVLDPNGYVAPAAVLGSVTADD